MSDETKINWLKTSRLAPNKTWIQIVINLDTVATVEKHKEFVKKDGQEYFAELAKVGFFSGGPLVLETTYKKFLKVIGWDDKDES